MAIITFKGCKHLQYDKDKLDNRIELKEIRFMPGVYWRRPDVLSGGQNKDCQFCDLRGRLNSKISCLEYSGFECDKGEMAEHNVEIE